MIKWIEKRNSVFGLINAQIQFRIWIEDDIYTLISINVGAHSANSYIFDELELAKGSAELILKGHDVKSYYRDVPKIIEHFNKELKELKEDNE